MELKFVKMHGTGNDFVVIDVREINNVDWKELSGYICDRHFGIGADQLLLLGNTDVGEADYKMRIFNPDGSEVEMCGNGIRCFAKFAATYVEPKNRYVVDTLAGLIIPEIIGDYVKVDMGEPELEGRKIPINVDGKVIDYPLEIDGIVYKITGVSMGNPHAVIKVDSVDSIDLEKMGPKFENNPLFPNRINTEFIEVVGNNELKMRVWERGAGETLACGTGASASTVAAILNNWIVGPKVKLHLKGGELEVEWNQDTNHVFLYGPAVEVFSGFMNINNLKRSQL